MRTLRQRAHERGESEEGFTILELIVAMTILTTTMLVLAYGLFGSMSALTAIHTRSAIQNVTTEVMEELRALPYASVGVMDNDATRTAEYPSDQFAGRDWVLLPAATVPAAPAAREVLPPTAAGGTKLPERTVTRHVTWTDTNAGTAHVFKRLHVRVSWLYRGQLQSEQLESVLYPGDIGPPKIVNQPIARFGVSPANGVIEGTDPLNPVAATVFTFDAQTCPECSEAPGGLGPLTYIWNFGDGSAELTTSSATVSHSYATVGVKSILLKVRNTAGTMSAPVSHSVNVGNPYSTPPDAGFTVSSTTGLAPLPVNILTNDSTDPENDPLTFTWDWGDGTPLGQGATPSHEYITAGSYTLTLTATDPSGLSDTATALIVVGSSSCQFVVVGGRKAFLENPITGNPGPNDIELQSDTRRWAKKPDFRFTAYTTMACNNVRFAIPLSASTPGFFSVASFASTNDGTTKTWTATGHSPDTNLYDTGAGVGSTYTAEIGTVVTATETVNVNIHL